MRGVTAHDVEITCKRVNNMLGFGYFGCEQGGTHLYTEISNGPGHASHRDLLWGTRKECLAFVEGFENALELAARSK